jgi:hypothetical protein
MIHTGDNTKTMSPFVTANYDHPLASDDAAKGTENGQKAVRFYCGAGSRIIDTTTVDFFASDLLSLLQATTGR